MLNNHGKIYLFSYKDVNTLLSTGQKKAVQKLARQAYYTHNKNTLAHTLCTKDKREKCRGKKLCPHCAQRLAASKHNEHGMHLEGNDF